MDDTEPHRKIEDFSFFRDAAAVHDVKLRFFKGWGHLVFDNFDPRTVADDLAALLDLLNPAHVEPH